MKYIIKTLSAFALVCGICSCTLFELDNYKAPGEVLYGSVTDVKTGELFVSRSSSVGYRARDLRWSSYLEYQGSGFDSKLGEGVVIKSNGTIPSGQKVFVHAAARINYDTPRGSGTRRWNYSNVMEIDVL